MNSLLETFPDPKLVKIDVEGAEINVMDGGKKILQKVRPIFFIEADIKTRPCITNIFLYHKYALFKDIHSFEAGIEINGVIQLKDTLCVPREKLDLIRNNLC